MEWFHFHSVFEFVVDWLLVTIVSFYSCTMKCMCIHNSIGWKGAFLRFELKTELTRYDPIKITLELTYFLTFSLCVKRNIEDTIDGSIEKLRSRKERERESLFENICMKKAFVTSNIVKSINIAWEVPHLHAIQMKVKVFYKWTEKKTLIFTLFRTNNSNNSISLVDCILQ